MALQWREHYNIFTASVGKGALSLTVAWDSLRPKSDPSPKGYTVTVAGRRLKQEFPDVEDGKKAAIALAKRIVQEISQELG